ncbi:putative phage abortive infection protein [Qipengyuania sp. 1XM1-15A]|uniref:putative phage abortive infection protein n=1 Tax=Qipengyuania xiamenensis TaxID=2867237 RepID=UPI001C87BFE6|nr:putative phage abortive infection protein [Qipengyuania xiamenensis]MBX7532762.1 putative phage abortive infection protein [Qipengyuania xiamenensis]
MASLAAAGAWIAVGQTREQSFEATFYNLLDQLTQIVAGTDIQGKKSVVGLDGKKTKKNTDKFEGKDAFSRMLRNLRLSVAGSKGASQEDRVIKGFRSFHDKYQNDLAHYFRTVYHIVRYVHYSNSSNKQLFMNILRAQMSDAEQTLLMYNCSVGKGREKFKNLVEEYSLLHNCSRNKDSKHWENTVLRPAFKSTAFRDDKIEVWPSASDLQSDIEKSQAANITD